MPERLDDLEVIIALAHEQLDGFAGGLHCGRKIARLALELGRFERAIRHDDRRVEVVEMALRAQQVLHLIGERDVGAADREAHGLQVEHAATAQPTLDDIRREVKSLAPVGGEEHAGEMAA